MGIILLLAKVIKQCAENGSKNWLGVNGLVDVVADGRDHSPADDGVDVPADERSDDDNENPGGGVNGSLLWLVFG
jgi:hypothetical protein